MKFPKMWRQVLIGQHGSHSSNHGCCSAEKRGAVVLFLMHQIFWQQMSGWRCLSGTLIRGNLQLVAGWLANGIQFPWVVSVNGTFGSWPQLETLIRFLRRKLPNCGSLVEVEMVMGRTDWEILCSAIRATRKPGCFALPSLSCIYQWSSPRKDQQVRIHCK